MARKNFMDRLGKQLGYNRMEDWYNLEWKSISNFGGESLFNQFHESPERIVRSTYPEHKWLTFLFGNVPNGYWNNMENVQLFMNWLGNHLGFKSMNDWYKLKQRHISDLGYGGILQQFKGSPFNLLQSVYPTHQWDPIMFSKIPKGYWKMDSHVRSFMDKLYVHLEFKNMTDWLKLSKKDIIDFGGQRLLASYGNSPARLIKVVYPDYDFEYLLGNLPPFYWDKCENRKNFMDKLGLHLGLKNMNDWYRVKYQDICDFGGKRLLDKYSKSPSMLLRNIYPEHNWIISEFEMVPVGYWDKLENVKQFLDKLGYQLGFKKMEDWYKLNYQTILEGGGSGLLRKYGGLSKLIQIVYPNHNWEVNRFNTKRQSPSLETKEEKREFINWLSQQMSVRDIDDWYRVSFRHINEVVPTDVFKKYPLELLLQDSYPEHAWDINKWKNRHLKMRSSQRRLLRTIEDIFPNSDILENYRCNNFISDNGLPIELDIFLPKEKLAFEYQGEGHYQEIYVLGEPISKQQQRDQEKKKMCENNDIILIEVPHWWDFKSTSLIATIKSHKYNLLEG